MPNNLYLASHCFHAVKEEKLNCVGHVFFMMQSAARSVKVSVHDVVRLPKLWPTYPPHFQVQTTNPAASPCVY